MLIIFLNKVNGILKNFTAFYLVAWLLGVSYSDYIRDRHSWVEEGRLQSLQLNDYANMLHTGKEILFTNTNADAS